MEKCFSAAEGSGTEFLEESLILTFELPCRDHGSKRLLLKDCYGIVEEALGSDDAYGQISSKLVYLSWACLESNIWC